MRRRLLAVATAILVLSLVPSAVHAQSRNTGAIRGTVTDETGGRIPGVVVEISSPDMIGGRRVMTTDANGNYRFPELPPGTFTLSFTISGYKAEKHEGIVINAAKSFDLDVKLTPQSGEETITVIGQTPLVDVTSAGTTTNFNEAYLQNLPTGRFQPDTLNLAPGIENSSAYGGGGSAANAYQIDGVDVSDPEGGTPWSFLNYNIIKEVQLIGLGAPAEYGGFTGVLFNSVTKSGSNEFEGMAELYYFPPGLVPTNTHEFAPEDTSRIKRSFDSTFQVGGPFIKDKLWYFVSAQYLDDEQSQGGPIRTEKDPRLFAKLSWQANPSNKLELWAEWDRYDITGRGGDAFHPIETTVTEDAPEYVWNFNWTRIMSANTSFNVAYTGYTGYYYLDPAAGYSKRGRTDSDGQASNNSTYFYLADRYRHDMIASLSHYSDTFLTGKHDFKYGVEFEHSRTRSRAGIPGSAYYYDRLAYLSDDDNDPNTPLVLHPEVDYAYVGYYTYDQKAINQRLTTFAQDKWQINDRLTIEPGVRVDFNRGSIPGQGNVYRANPIAPRLGFSFDLTGKKKTVLKGHYGRYFEGLKSNYYQFLGPHAASPQFYYQVDANTPGFTFDPATIDPNNPPPGVTLLANQPQQRYRLDHDTKQPYVDQYLLALEHDLGNDFALKAEFIYRVNSDFIESVSLNGDFTRVRAIDSDTDKPIHPKLWDQGNLDDVLIITNPSGLERRYKAAIFTATKRFSKRWQMLASYARQNARGNIDNVDVSFSGLQGSNYGPSPFLDTPNSTVNWRGTLTNDFKNELTLQGQYVIPKVDVTVAADYRYVSGAPYTKVGRSVEYLSDPNDPNSARIPFNQGHVNYFVEPRGSRRLDSLSILNFRAEKYFSFKGGVRLGIFGDVFNVFNNGEDTEVITRRGGTFGDAATVQTPRQVRFGVRYNW